MVLTENVNTASTSETNRTEEPRSNIKTNADKEGETSQSIWDVDKPKIVRQGSMESVPSIDGDGRRLRRESPMFRRRHSISPMRERNLQLSSSTQLLEKVNKHDGMADLPYSSRASIYMTTYPFTDKDVKKWSWLLPLGLEDMYLAETSRNNPIGSGSDEDDDNITFHVKPVRQGGRYRELRSADIPSAYLSRALDTDIVPEDTENLRYVMVVQNRHRPAGSKLLVADSRKAAGIQMFYELTRGESIVFVGAVVQACTKVRPAKFKRVQTVEEAIKIKEDGFVGVIC